MTNRRGLSIRAAQLADAADICVLLASAAHPAEQASLAARLTAISAGQGAALAAWEWGPPSGLVVLHWYDALHGPARIAQIDLLLVAEQARRRGIGRLLIKASAQAARTAGCGALHLNAAPGDDITEAFCQATGFTATGRRFARALRKGGA